MRLCASARDIRRGLTLIELLVVIIILTTVVAAAIPILAPAGSDRELREATRGLNTYITGAQTRAVATRRPFGIAIKRLAQDTNPNPTPANYRHPDNGVSLEVYYVEQQSPYSGFDPNSRVCVGINRQTGLTWVRFVTRGTPTGASVLPPGWVADLFPANFVRSGDVIEIGKTRFELKDSRLNAPAKDNSGFFPGSDGSVLIELIVEPINDTGQLINIEYDNVGRALRDGPPPSGPALQRPYWTAPMTYRILRQPTATSDAPYQLPEGTAIDLRASGWGRENFFYVPNVRDNPNPVVIMFTPEGRVERVSFNTSSNTAQNLFDESVVENLFLLIGKRENVPAPQFTDDATLDVSKWNALTTDAERLEAKAPVNWLNSLSRWLVIGSQSGRVVSIENAFVDPLLLGTLANDEPTRNKQILTAREFTSQMANMGGR